MCNLKSATLRNNHVPDTSLQGWTVDAHNLGDLLAIVEEEERRHLADTKLPPNVGQVVNVDLVKLDVRVLIGELVELGRDGHRGTTPVGEAV